jgi:excisionase family DNA binding protein
MAEEKEYLSVPGHVPVKEAAAMLGVSEDRILDYIEDGRLPSHKVNGRHMISLQDIKSFRRQAHGRQRKQAVPWRIYRAGAKIYGLQIAIQAVSSKREELQARLQQIAKEQQHLFKGTMLRHVFACDDNPDNLIIELIWKDTELADEADLQRELAAFKAAFADVLDWETARYRRLQALIHT